MNGPGNHGLLVLDKPPGITSRAAVDQVQTWFPRGTRIGHTGTLDPFATGVLVICIGKATRLAEFVQDMPKTYKAGVRLGARSSTDDIDGAVTSLQASHRLELGEITGALASFVGEIEQVPPAYSAAKVAGRRAYKLARRGQEVTIKARKIIIHRIDLISYEYPQLQLEVRCGKGTYIRSLARDLGEKLRCGAFVETLRRTRVGLFGVEEAVPLDVAPEVARGRLLPLAAAVAGLGKVIFPTKVVEQLRSGKAISGKLCLNADPKGNDGLAAGFADDGTLLAILKHGQDKDDWQPIKVLMDIPKPASR